MVGLEPTRLSTYAPEAYVYTNFTTSAKSLALIKTELKIDLD